VTTEYFLQYQSCSKKLIFSVQIKCVRQYCHSKEGPQELRVTDGMLGEAANYFWRYRRICLWRQFAL